MSHIQLKYNSRSTGLALDRVNPFPIDSSTLWDKIGDNGKLKWHDPAWGIDHSQDYEVNTTQELANLYAACSIAYTGQIISVVNPDTGLTDVYKINDSGNTRVAVLLVPNIDININYNDPEIEINNGILHNEDFGNSDGYGFRLTYNLFKANQQDLVPGKITKITLFTRADNTIATSDEKYCCIMVNRNNTTEILDVSINTNTLSGENQECTYIFSGEYIFQQNDIIYIIFKTDLESTTLEKVGLKAARNTSEDCGFLLFDDFRYDNSYLPKSKIEYKLISPSVTVFEDDKSAEIATKNYVQTQINNAIQRLKTELESMYVTTTDSQEIVTQS